MRRNRVWARGVAVALGLLAGGQALAESEPCLCDSENQRVVSDYSSCLLIRAEVGCSLSEVSKRLSEVSNQCGRPVTLLAWPLVTESCQGTACTVELQPGASERFNFAGMADKATSGPAEATYHVRVDGQDSPVTISAEVTCRERTSPPPEGCSSAPGSLAALGLLLLAGPVVRARRRG
ncbi:MXAN_0125 family MYXO-CTERM protein [Pyxidicoccus xibeiensis]|uniref:MXAN_0125 family MYXO-CTERM protein n=1 Tax=Pyxidicoccus xibeiensis TaxID=2906759 RepID=UPI0020A80B19|nr:MXAN_0125 family MYXO-CTERM protein [Pyxidicoccus xibeiensis]MCP3136960.1 hypothetical protein [Pyxidicoccus xibeiensis]